MNQPIATLHVSLHRHVRDPIRHYLGQVRVPLVVKRLDVPWVKCKFVDSDLSTSPLRIYNKYVTHLSLYYRVINEIMSVPLCDLAMNM